MTAINEIYEAVRAILREQAGGQAGKDLQYLARVLFQRAVDEELNGETPAYLVARIRQLYEFIQIRQGEKAKLRVFDTPLGVDDTDTPSSIIQILNTDRPFLVDSITLLLAEQDIQVLHLFHPVLGVVRDATGKLQRIVAAGDEENQSGYAQESLIQINIEHLPVERMKKLEQKIAKTLSLIQRSVDDWKPMCAQAERAAEFLEKQRTVDRDASAEAARFIRWLLDDHFIFLGYREYEVRGRGEKAELRALKDTGLGMLSDEFSPRNKRLLSTLPDIHLAEPSETPEALIITKTNSRSFIHRSGYMDYIGVKRYDKSGRAVGERRFIGLFTSNTYTRSAWDTPLLRKKVEQVMRISDLRPGSHIWKALVHILETLPRDELFQASSEELSELALGVLKLQERPRTRLFIRRENFGRFFSCLLYIPRDQFNTENRIAAQTILKRALKGKTLDYHVQVSESALARLHILVRPRKGEDPQPDINELESKIVKAVRSWQDELQEILIQKLGESEGRELFQKNISSVPASYAEDVSPWVASFDLLNIDALEGEDDLRMSLYRPRKQRVGVLRFKIFKHSRPIPLSEVLPMLENLGLRIVSERPYEFRSPQGKSAWIQDFDMVLANGGDLDIEAVRNIFQQAFEKTWRGEIESDGFNRLVLAARLPWRQVSILRAYCKYLLQTGIPYSQAYMAETMEAHPLIARLLVELFKEQFDPVRQTESATRASRHGKRLKKILRDLDPQTSPAVTELLNEVISSRIECDRQGHRQAIKAAISRALELVSSLDQDRIFRAFRETIGATLRSNYFCQDEAGNLREYLSFKLDSARVPDLPRPCPYREIWVYSPRVEGVHLRMGAVARGGLRWSDRREDFRTEVLGLMKAQNVKNTMIVPVGAKGGFFVKRMPEGDRETVMAEVIHCYRSFIRGLLDITDNLDEDTVVYPENVVRLDGDDPYLVVAADKGTATFSDIANEVALDYGFWLGDAFASGGSAGYDHKAMGITAKGAWESVKRHFRELGKDIQSEDFTVVGIGDMGGDVFGNGMLLSQHIRLRAAFNHLHIFLDPDPDPARSYAERKRLFELPRSSWEDYNPDLISRGGGVFSRQLKTIDLSPEVRAWLGVEEEQMTPSGLIRQLLKADVDLLWNGGIGTYVKASTESHSEVGDATNNHLRINGKDLKCKVVGEGGNLGLTQLGRVEYALAGGKINTDFIDNSAGVDCSDHEVNIKILLNQLMRQKKLDPESRNRLLVEMTADVERLVLRSNYLQSQTLSMMRYFSSSRIGAQAHFIRALEQEGLLDRELEYLPPDEVLDERRQARQGLTRPELSVLLSYAKIVLYQQLLDSDVPEDSYLSRELLKYFPVEIQNRYADEVNQHRLKREIIATMVTNAVINRMGASFVLMMQEATGCGPGDIAKAFTIVRDTFELVPLWREIEALDNRIEADVQIEALLVIWKVSRHATRWMLVENDCQLDIQASIETFRPGIRQLHRKLPELLGSEDRRLLARRVERYRGAGFSESMATSLALFKRLPSALDIVAEAKHRNLAVIRVAEVYYKLGQALNLKWLMGQIEDLAVEGQWHSAARSQLRQELFGFHRAIAGDVSSQFGEQDTVAAWLEANRASLDRLVEMLADMRTLPELDYATISVAIRELKKLLGGNS